MASYMEDISFGGVHFWMNENRELFAYNDPSVKVGSYSKERILTLIDDWLDYYLRPTA